MATCLSQCGPNSLCTGALDPQANYSCSCQPGYTVISGHCVVPTCCTMGNGGCSQICSSLSPSGPVTCSCNAGYALNLDGKICALLDSPAPTPVTTVSGPLNSTSKPNSTRTPTSTHPLTSAPSLISRYTCEDFIEFNCKCNVSLECGGSGCYYDTISGYANCEDIALTAVSCTGIPSTVTVL